VADAPAQTIITSKFYVVIKERCPEGIVFCKDVGVKVVEKSNCKARSLPARAEIRNCTGTDTPCQHMGWVFSYGGLDYRVTPSAEISATDSRGQEVLNEQGTFLHPDRAPGATVDSSAHACGLPPSVSTEPGDNGFICKYDGSQQEMNACAVRDYEAADRLLNQEYRKIMGGLTPAKRQTLLREQRAWLQKRDPDCRVDAGPMDQGGSSWPLEYFGCLKSATELRTKELGQWESRH
jgi:uncharacterized protein YecT (DUF1311 family)